MMVSLDGFFEGENHDLSWHNVDSEFNEFAAKQLLETGALLFGKRTYELMFDYWPTATHSDQNDAIVANKMNSLPKYVFSHTMKKIEEYKEWKDVTLINSDIENGISILKNKSGQDIAVLGSNALSVSLLELGLMDEIRIMINPIVLGNGTRFLNGIKNKLAFHFESHRVFKSGNVLSIYSPSNKPS